MLREAVIIAPLRNNEGQPVATAHDTLQRRLLQYFGGFTYTVCVGGWKGAAGKVYRDVGRRYFVACDPDKRADIIALRWIADMLRIEARQYSVYLRLPDGTVEFVEGGVNQFDPERDAFATQVEH